ncbi:hypothetical protein BJ138DRAFT_1173373 [Hygrophoropsis aurantiaca]|uniref:Uncharacterized protein n=1 Tax=Hygrophoropsis aurantiaca TaxID=72124 RepID=A0ACB8ABK3_9AGAM|nr:hypothetical protein BJ138DRAFT_1173373 [Hygrophoropsis aurantiaca]
MAQAVFDGHPLEEYLREADEELDIMPGGASDFSHFQYPIHDLSDDPESLRFAENMENLLLTIFGAIELVVQLFASDRMAKRTLAFAERFKYGVISSTLLSPGFPSTPLPHPGRRSFSPSIPGKLASGHSRNTSVADSTVTDNTLTLDLTIPPASESDTPVWPLTLSCTLAVAALSARFYFVCIMLVAGTIYYVYVHKIDIHTKPDLMTPSLEALAGLIAAGQVWDSVVNDTLTILESEERSPYFSPITPSSSPSSSLRVALHSSLLTTQTQCDNVRQLLAAITCPSELSQLSEMYAPPSPVSLTFSLNDHTRPLSLPGRQRTLSAPDRDVKRATWNGSYAALASHGSPTFHLTKRREKRRSDLSAVIGGTRRSSLSAPTSPSPTSALANVEEEEDHSEPPQMDKEPESFGAAALGLQRKRRSDGLQTFGLPISLPSPPPKPSFSRSRSAPKQPGPSRSRPSTMSPASRFTTLQASRHPLSITSLQQALSSALSSKRYACSHLLALRFEDDEDQGYWEDARSVMGLLTSALVDASARLGEALEDAEDAKLREGEITPERSLSPSLSTPEPNLRPLLSQPIVSFAPMPSHLSRFAAHVHAISSALNDARDHLEQCVASLGDESSPLPDSDVEHPALQAYDRLRRELGLALRECERGREKLINSVTPPKPTLSDDGEGESDDVPALHPDMGSDESDKPDDLSPMPQDDIELTVVSPDGETIVTPDDATSHLLLSQRLPPPGIEQVFEAEPDSGTSFVRERSKLTREERIKLAKARRESGGGLGLGITDSPSPPSKIERWGPGGEVVQELKDVIWKVDPIKSGGRKLNPSGIIDVDWLLGAAIFILCGVGDGAVILDDVALGVGGAVPPCPLPPVLADPWPP